MYTITFDSNGGSEVAAQEVEENVAATAPEAPTKDGYTFVEWLDGETAYDWNAPVTGNLKLTAKWDPVKYKITYLPDGVKTDNPTTYTIEEAFELKAPTNAPDATKPNFVAWHKGEKPTEGAWVIVDSIEKGTIGDLTIVAEFSEKTIYVVTYYIGETKKTQNVVEGNAFTLTGYNLFTDKEFKTAYTAKEVTANIELYAQAKAYTVTFDSGVASQTIKYNGTATEPTAPTKEGYTFIGWYEGETKFNFATKITKDISLTAKWEEKKAVEPEVSDDALATVFKFGETYSGKVTYPMIENSGYGNATASEVMFNIDLSEQTLKTKDVVKVSFKITECSSEVVTSIACQSALKWDAWNSVNAKKLGDTYNFSLEVGENLEFKDNLLGVKFIPQGDKSLIGNNLVIKIEDLSVTLVPYVEGSVQTKFTNDNWIKTGVEKQYDGVYIDWADIGLPEDFNFSDYAYLKINATLLKDDVEVITEWNTGFIHLSDADGNNVQTISNINNNRSSDYNSTWFPIGELESAPAKISVQNAQNNVDTIKVNYLEFVSIEEYSKLLLEPTLKNIITEGVEGNTVVFGIVYTDEATSNNGVGQLQLDKSPWTVGNVRFISGSSVAPNKIEEFEVSYKDIKSDYDNGYTAWSFYNGALLQYVYIK